MEKASFTPAVTPNAIAIIKACSDDTFFIMEQKQPVRFYDPEELDLQPHCIRNKGNLQEITKMWERLENRVRLLHQSEKAELFSREEGGQYTDRCYVNMVVFKGSDAITLTLCTKQKALELAL